MLRRFETVAPQLAAGAWVDEMALVLGDVTLAEDVSVWPFSVLRGDVNRIRVGARTNVQDGTVIHVAHAREGVSPGLPTLIGADVTIGHRAIIHACTIGNACLIGMGAIVMDGAVLGDESMLAAGSVVPPGKRLEGGWLYVGSPAQPKRRLLDAERENLYYSAAHYVSLVRRHRADPDNAQVPPPGSAEATG
jgi:carbonic anhydrase/acetyltransferase-like protein (isoleucine patch superfamily)